jgi:hypothetical protein
MAVKILILDRPSLDSKALFTQTKLVLTRNPDNTFSKYDAHPSNVVAAATLADAERHLSHDLQVIFVDIFAFPLSQSIHFVGTVRNAFPWITFILFIYSDDFQNNQQKLPEEWQRRFGHYYKIYKDGVNSKRFSRDIRTILSTALEEALWNASGLTDLMEYGTESEILKETYTHAKPSLIHNIPLSNRPFISYTRSDIVFVDWLWQEIEARGYWVWLDRKDIKPGDVWDDKIDEALRTCPIMLLALSPAASDSKNVAKEWKYFMSLNKPIIPLLWQDCQLHFQLADLQYIDFRDYRDQGLDELIEVLKQHLV